MLCCPRCFALLAHVCLLFAAYLPSDPSLASSQPTRAGAYTVGHISWHGYVRTSPCVSDGVWFFGGVCFRLRAIFISVSSSWSSVVGVRVWSAVVRAWFGRRAWIPRRATRYVRGNADLMHCRVHALVRPLNWLCARLMRCRKSKGEGVNVTSPISDCAVTAAPWSEIHGTFPPVGAPSQNLTASAIQGLGAHPAICSHGGGGLLKEICGWWRAAGSWRPWVISRLSSSPGVSNRAGNRENAGVFPGNFLASALPHCLLETAGRFRVRDFRGVRGC